MAPTLASNTCFLFFVYFLCETVFTEEIQLGSSISPTDPTTSWPSPSGRFAFGFYEQGDGFKVGIWLSDGINKTIVWTANRNDPPVSAKSRLNLTRNGELLLQTGPEKNKVIADGNNGTVFYAAMLDSGNFVLQNETLGFLWQSFDYPTDTLLGGQILLGGSELVSTSSDTNQSSGRFQLSMQVDGNLVLYPRYSDARTWWDAYWASDSDRGTSSKYYLFLNNTNPQPLCIVNASSSNSQILWRVDNSSFEGNNIIYRVTIDSDGVLRLYAHFDDANREHQVKELWSPTELNNQCNVKSFCGLNSYCTFYDNQPSCSCLPGTDFIDPSQRNLGCKRNFSEAECKGGKDNATFYRMIPMPSMNMGDPYVEEYNLLEEECLSSCLQDCYCGAVFYEDNRCRKQKLPLRYVTRVTQGSSSYTLYFKVGVQSLKSNTVIDNQPPPIKTTSKKAIVQIIVVIFGFASLLCSAVTISTRFIYKIRVLSYKRLLEIGDLGLNEGVVTLRLFSYNELKKATDGFKQEVGKGSFGSVYKGTLHKGSILIAVKRLQKLAEEGEKEFQAEMQAIGKTNHKNLVRLLGYCAEGSKRLLVYEYMSSGSLEKLIFGDSTIRPDWDQRRRIALEIARGLLYLHEECGAPIIHCDIKPQNILMDEFWTAKISDFGLAKLLMPDQTRTFTQVRGTRGYLAPEWNKNTPISVKADVYSYGILLLEIAFCRRNLVVNSSNPEQIVLCNWVYKCFVQRELNKLVLGEEVDLTLLENMVKVGIWCIQDEPFLRPSMKSVVLMLEGVSEVAIPPCPSSNSM
ncbi:hypothetical protein QN277_026273 [Acacia crassicarpa]|uniref:Receptor-like serine/threonine-protein kinase n=1 Tax=Acacia crassicarpa TaxID=499986 RepID=A0AAE1J910_9FABA|nr:hypothetical protein QN277_026273 [Acacia crassicarpa]